MSRGLANTASAPSRDTVPRCARCAKPVEVMSWTAATRTVTDGYEMTEMPTGAITYRMECHGEYEEVYVPEGVITDENRASIVLGAAFVPGRERDPYVRRGKAKRGRSA